MNLIYYHYKKLNNIGAREIMFSLLSLFAVTLILSTSQGGHIKCILSVWKAEFGFELHSWQNNIIRIKESED